MGPHPVSLPLTTIEAVKKATHCQQHATRLTGPIYEHAVGTFNTCSRGPTHRFLTDISEGYNFRGAGFPRTTPRPSQPAVSTFHLRVPLSLRLSKIYHRFQGSSLRDLWPPHGFLTTQPSTITYIYA
jgi:hypothetical protein